LAGLSCALELAEKNIQVTIVSNSKDPSESNTAYAQGGVAYVDPDKKNGDSLVSLANDIKVSGDGICYEPAVEQLTQLGNRLIKEKMIDALKIPFERNPQGRLLTNHEGAHSTNRVIHIGDATGKAIHKAYLRAVEQHSQIELLTNHTAVDILTTEKHAAGYSFKYDLHNNCCGAYLLDNQTNKVEKFIADFTVLATGGVGQLFLHSTNSPSSIGAGMVMAMRAGAALLFPHYIQFHPTALYKGKRRFLISEVLRGAGAQLLNSNGERFMQRYNPKELELAPRDELTRAIVEEMIQNQEDCVYLDLSTVPRSDGKLEERFPTIYEECLKFGIDIRHQPIPVVPAAHYHCGGVKVDLFGRTSLNRLFAIGEVSCTGLHGANRLASTSLTECLTWGYQAAQAIHEGLSKKDLLTPQVKATIRDWEETGKQVTLDKQRLAGDWSRIRTMMWNYVGILRSKKLLEIASKDFRLLGESLSELYFDAAMSQELVDLFHGIQACQIIVDAARKDPVSLGCHYIV
jgi:L-aspartate oxidase